jgi:multidrug efflux system membrane fusion protein
MRNRWLLLVIFSTAVPAALSGCRQSSLAQDSSKLPVFAVSHPVQREVTDYVEYTGRTAAVQAEEIKARVTGFLEDMFFEEGAEIKKDAVLFKIDPRPYKAQFDQADAQVALY